MELTFKEHLKELKQRVLTALIFFVAMFALCFYYAEDILEGILILGGDMTFAYLYPQEVFLQYLNISILLAFLLAIPVITLEVTLFVIPAMETQKEKRGLLTGAILADVLFYLGIVFALVIMIPFVLEYFAKVNAETSLIGAVSVEKYISLLKTLLLSFGVVFEIPILSAILAKAHILTPERMKKGRGISLVVIFILAALITPPDVISQCLVAIPMMVLYQVSIWITALITRKRGNKP